MEMQLAQMLKEAVRDESALRQALSEANTGPMLMVHAQLTGDTSLLDKAKPFIQGAWPHMQVLPDELRGEIADALVDALKALAAQGPHARPALSGEALHGIMAAGVGQDVAREYLPLLLEETAMVDADPRSLQWQRDPAGLDRENFSVVIVGAGFSGIVAGIRLKQAGIPFVILEKNPTAAGTWYENRYPGCGVDTVSHFYSFSFRPNNSWSHYFAKRDEIYNYIEETVDHFDLRQHIVFGVEVSQMAYDDSSARWSVTYRHGEAETLIECNAVISAVGLINRPSVPDIPGLDKFQGPQLHTAAWDESVDLKGKRVAMIGTGASGMQVGPTLAPQLSHLYVLQRSAHWVNHNPLYHSPVPPGQQWALENVPYFSQWQRFMFFWGSSDGLHASLKVDPEWGQPELSLNAQNHATREMLIAYMHKQLDGREDLIAKCTPDYPPYGKRMLRDNHWFSMLKRSNVSLVTSGISYATEKGIVLKDGTSVEVDAIVFATGFHAGKMLWPMTVKGRGGVTIRDIWGDENPRAYKGITVPGFPNLFLTSGPNTGLAHGGSHFFHSECQVKYIVEAIREMVEQGHGSLEVRQEAHDRFNEQVESKVSGMVWAHPNVKSWYKNSDGRVTVISPWRLVEYWGLTRRFDAQAYLTEPATQHRKIVQARQSA